MGVMADCGINVTYSYSLISTYIALSVKDLARAEQLLAGRAGGAHRARTTWRAPSAPTALPPRAARGGERCGRPDCEGRPPRGGPCWQLRRPARVRPRQGVRAARGASARSSWRSLRPQVAWTYERVAWYRERMDALGVAPGDIQHARRRAKAPRSRTSPCCATRSPTACSPCRSTRSWSCMRPPGTTGQAHRGGLQRPRHGRVERLHRALRRRWQASYPATARRWRSATACSPGASGCITAARSSAA